MTRDSARTLRTACLLALAGFGVHQARYALAADHRGDVGHGYLTVAPVLLALVLALALGHAIAATAAGRASVPRRRLQRGWLWSSVALVVLHVVQEAAERLIAGGGPLDAGWLLVVPLCIVAGGLVALGLRGADEALAAVARALPRPPLDRPPTAVLVPPAPVPRPAAALARHLAGRAPPLALG
ncbi:MAG TPA: hypothetical protein VGJ70_15285 [Solirubrobacteraceae bacterium]